MVKSQPILRYIWRAVPAVAVAMMLSACGSNSAYNHKAQTDMHAVNDKDGLLLQASQDEFEALVRNVDIKSKLLNQYASWKGVRYRLGGDSRRGIDCSAFVQRTFREQFGMDLPRSTYEQQEMGQKIQRNKLRVGDLVLFRAGSTGRHVGIYLGNDQFVHASTSSGVIISKMTEDYWNKRYQEGRRVLSKGTTTS
ncbi:bifunctional murein DD-endopeptidase/murein LD-carboxypeptidase [Pectobacterium aroidearum]|jgi:lipoprotein Spr|uniref:Bifunctional murein DD-endopeptidase/murein LD-carboxypeptidase n=2 Tax=Pectobacterium TaxID=122277 RepID=A0AAW3SPP8_9GAMM|nr:MULTISPECIES: bifunctional murein DD-endopeptidase/murein LD-carboxypeptidase [Pectobacterium]ACT12687.1 NLP/P60 protein [Pectobacterium carotovorum subsp. carotovorum PC1]MBA0203554.1 bifunctional murein DD-endopeptidase/murein LD-carboxypeptidase [Pectobacterium aroidearum]MBA5197823.1 bifunctional murein DD-endopeptidase/murein LD-carboxypeptidase [Pectobacterium aroidearum]MBA5202424.1 bifunctional murein DD-endopeptidase/murein LD-carboxypeptidase [Pectobacterium aroidearum]MBA5227634.